jgi:hypothetical protein
VEMDQAAKQNIAIAKQSSFHFLIQYEPWSIWADGHKLITNLSKTLYNIVHSEEAKEYWTGR